VENIENILDIIAESRDLSMNANNIGEIKHKLVHSPPHQFVVITKKCYITTKNEVIEKNLCWSERLTKLDTAAQHWTNAYELFEIKVFAFLQKWLTWRRQILEFFLM